MASGRRSHMPKPFGPSLCKACSTHEVLLCTLPPKQKGSSSSTNRRPRPSADLDLPADEFDPVVEPPPYPLPCHPSPSPSSNSPTDPKTSPDSPSTPLSHLPDSPFLLPSPTATQVMYPTRVSSERGGRTRGPHPSPCAIFIVRHEQNRRKVRIIF